MCEEHGWVENFDKNLIPILYILSDLTRILEDKCDCQHFILKRYGLPGEFHEALKLFVCSFDLDLKSRTVDHCYVFWCD